MKVNERFRETWVEHRCANGLSLVIIEKPQFLTSAFLLLIPFGNLDQKQADDAGTVFRAPSGTAHFLEHKLFESGAEDVMTAFSRLGANVNASTSYDMTSYYFTTPSSDIQEPLDLLLDFVQDLSVTKASVDKEKKIILEELSMYMQDPDSRLFYESMRSLYYTHPIRDDIVGTQESIRSIRRSDLYDAYERNYHPSRMTLVAVTSARPEEIIEIVERNQASKGFKPFSGLHRYVDFEPKEVNISRLDVPMAIERPRSAVTFKLPVLGKDPIALIKQEWSLRFALETMFSALNPDYQKWIDQGYITPYFGYDIDCSEDYSFLYFQDETGDIDLLKEFVLTEMDVLRHTVPDKESIRQLKRRVLGSEIRLLDSPADLIGAWGRGILRGTSLFEECEMVEQLTVEDCGQAVYDLEVMHSSAVRLVQNNNESKNH